jgi:addiction module HigA family antidote
VHGRSAITAPVALRLAKYFNTTPELWMNLQAGYELRKARLHDWPKIEKRVRVLAAE